MAKSGSRFSADIGRLLNKYDERADAIARQATQALAESIIVGGPYSPGTPKDTGFAQNSWYANLNEPPKAQPTNPGEGPATGGPAQVASVIATAKAGDVLVFRNFAAYGRRLEYGHSKQAADGMVRIGLAQFKVAVADAAKMLRGLA